MPSKVIRASDVMAMPIEFGFIPTERPPQGFAEQLEQLNAVVHEVAPAGSLVASLSGDPGAKPILRHYIPAPDGVGMHVLYCQADSMLATDLRAAAAELHRTVLAAVAPFVKSDVEVAPNTDTGGGGDD